MTPIPKSIETPLQHLPHPLFEQYGIDVWIKRDDLNHPTIQGNKWHKLMPNLVAARHQGKSQLLTFGGAYSNHIAATAAAGKHYGFKTFGWIRGDELAQKPHLWCHTLKQAQADGMTFEFMSRPAYREKETPDFLSELSKRYPQAYLLPEGGTNALAVSGFEKVMQTIEKQCPEWTHLYTAVGTGGTLAGLGYFAARSPLLNQNPKHLYGIATLRAADYLVPQIQHLMQCPGDAEPHFKWQLLTQYSGAGYAKTSLEVINLNNWFKTSFNIELDPVYTSKMVFGFMQELKQNRIPKGAKVILYHSGGLQGNPPSASVPERV